MSYQQIATLKPTSTSHFREQTLQPWLLAVLFIAAGLRLIYLPGLPPGLNFDEAGSGVAGLEILSGLPKIWWRLGGGQEPLWPYLTALSTAILGHIPLALRLPAAFIGILTVAAVYPLLLTFRLGDTARDTRLIALLTALGLALSGWHLHFSRLGFRAILLPLFSTLAFYFFWRSLKSSQKSAPRNQGWKFYAVPNGSVILAAFFMALSVYSYLAGRLLLLAPVLFILLQGLISRINALRQNSPVTPPFQFSILISYFLFLFLFLTPLLIYFTLNPADFVARSATVSIFNPAWHQGDFAGTLWRTLGLTLGTFFGLSGDPNPLVNLPGQPALPAFLAIFFTLGLCISLYRLFSPAPRLSVSPHLFLLCWWVVMLLPALLAPEGAPHHLRLIGTLVPTYAFAAIGLTGMAAFLAKILPPIRPSSSFFSLLPTPVYLFLAFQTATNYFIHWPVSVDFTRPFDLYAIRLADDIAQTPSTTGYIIPMDIRAADEARHYTLDYLLGLSQSYTYIPVAEHTAAAQLTQAAQGKDQLRVVRWTDDKHREADAKEIITFLLETTAQFQERETFPVYDLETYRLLGPQTIFALPAINQPIGVNFDKLLRLEAAFVPPSAPLKGWLPVALTLAPLGPLEADYKVSLRLISPNGARIGQKDRILLHNFHQGTSLWPLETVNEYYLLPLPPETLPGNYTINLVIYHPDTLAPLVANGQAELPVGQVNLE